MSRRMTSYVNNQQGVIFEIGLLLLGLIGIMAVSGTGQTSKLTVQEDGYYYKHGVFIGSLKNISKDLVENIYNLEMKEDLHDDVATKELKLSIANSINNAIKALISNRAAIEETLPPDSLVQIHEGIKKYSEFIKNMRGPYDLKKLRHESLYIYNILNGFDKEVAKREPKPSSTIGANLYFVPATDIIPGIPNISINMKTGSFTVSQSIPVGFGKFVFSNPSAVSGAKILIIIYEGKKRYFSLNDKPFKIFIPKAEYGFSVGSEGKNDGILTITVNGPGTNRITEVNG